MNPECGVDISSPPIVWPDIAQSYLSHKAHLHPLLTSHSVGKTEHWWALTSSILSPVRFSKAPCSPRLMARLCNGNLWWAKQHKNTVPCLHPSQWFYALGENRAWGCVLGDSHVSVCVWDIYDWGTSTGPWVWVPFDWAAHVLFLKQAG